MPSKTSCVRMHFPIIVRLQKLHQPSTFEQFLKNIIFLISVSINSFKISGTYFFRSVKNLTDRFLFFSQNNSLCPVYSGVIQTMENRVKLDKLIKTKELIKKYRLMHTV